MATEVDIQSPIPVPISGHVVVDTGSIAIGNSINIANFPITYPVTGTVDIANLPAIQSVLLTNPLPILVATVGDVNIGNLPAVQTITGSVTVLNFPVVLPVTIANFPAIQAVEISGTVPINGVVTVSNFPSLQPVSVVGGVDILDRVSRSLGHVTVDNFPAVSGTVSVSNFPATQPVSGSISVSNFPATQPVSGTVAISNFPASQAVTGAFFQATQPVSIAATISADVTDRAARLLGHVTVDSLPSVAVNNFPATQPVSGTVAVSNFPVVQAVSIPVVPSRQSVMLSWERSAGGIAESALVAFTNGTLNAVNLAAASAYTVSAGKTLRITQINVVARATTNVVFNSRVRIRQAAAVTNASPIIWTAEIGASVSAVVAEAEFFESYSPDGGIEVAAGQQITFTHLESSATGTVSLVIIGYEY